MLGLVMEAQEDLAAALAQRGELGEFGAAVRAGGDGGVGKFGRSVSQGSG